MFERAEDPEDIRVLNEIRKGQPKNKELKDFLISIYLLLWENTGRYKHEVIFVWLQKPV